MHSPSRSIKSCEAVRAGTAGDGNLREHVAQSLRDRRLVRRGGRVLVAVSGGLDSTVLLHILRGLAAKLGLSVGVAHLDHGLRGAASRADARSVAGFSRRLGLPFFQGRVEVASRALAEKVSVEMAARRARHEFLAQMAQEHRYPVVALGHHADDQIELFILRLLRGGGSEGLTGMRWSGPSPADPKVRLIRPLLDVPRVTLQTYAVQQGLTWSEDATNTDSDFLRNRIRHELLPLLRREYQPGVDQCLLRTIEILAADAEFLKEEARRWNRGGEGTRGLGFAELPVALQRQCLRLQLLELGHAADFDLVEQLRLRPGTRIEIAHGLFATRGEAGKVELRRAQTPFPFQAGEVVVNVAERKGESSFGGVRVRWRVTSSRGMGKLKSHAASEVFDLDAVGSEVTLRHWRPGDRFWPIGGPGKSKLQDLLTNQKVPPAVRRRLVLAHGSSGEIFWVEGLRIGERFKLTKSTRKCLYWRWDRT